MSARDGGFDRLLAVLGHDPDAAVVVCHKHPGEAFTAVWTTADKAPEVADDHPGADVWFSVNALPHKGSGRGTAADVTRLAALYADLDIKPGGMATMSVSVAVIRTVSDMLGTVPTATVMTGHGLQPYWPLDPDDPAAAVTDNNRGDRVALLRRFGRLVGHVAAKHGGQVDTVFDLARVLRVPGTTNRKAEPVPTWLALAEGRPLTVAEVDEQLTAYGAVEQPGDRDVLGEVVAPAGEWPWAPVTDPAVTTAVASWGRQTPSARHPWLLGCATSLAFARRLGMVTETDHAATLVTITLRFHQLLQRPADRRDPSPGEVAAAFTFGVAVAERKTDDDAHTDWAFWTDLAGNNGTSPTVMAVSDATRANVGRYLAGQAAESNRARGEAEGSRAVAVAEKLDDHQVQRVGRTIRRALRRLGDWATLRDVAHAVASRDRAAVDDALTALVDGGQVEVRDDGGKHLYRVAEGS